MTKPEDKRNTPSNPNIQHKSDRGRVQDGHLQNRSDSTVKPVTPITAKNARPPAPKK